MNLDLSQEQLAHKINVTSKTIFNIEKGKDTTMSIALKLKKALQVKSLDDLFEDDDL